MQALQISFSTATIYPCVIHKQTNTTIKINHNQPISIFFILLRLIKFNDNEKTAFGTFNNISDNN